MNSVLLLRFLHIAGGMLLVGGVVAGLYVGSLTKKAEEVRDLAAFSRITDLIEQRMVLPGASLVFIFGIIMALQIDRPILGFLQGASENWLLLALTLLIIMTLVGMLVAQPRRKKFVPLMAEALTAGQITPELRAAAADPLVRAVHWYELASVVAVLFLMVFKPF